MKIARHLPKVGYMICTLFLLGGLLKVPISQGATYYVAPGGNDSNPGTQTQPFQTIGRGASRLSPGDTLYVRAGTYQESFFNSIPSGTSWDAPVTIAAFPRETPTIRPGPGTGQVFVFQGVGTHHIIMDGLDIDAVNASYDIVKITWANDPTDRAHDIQIKNSEMKNGGSNGILVMGDGNTFSNLKIHDNGIAEGSHGIYIASADNLVEGCEIHDNGGWGVHIYDHYDNAGKVNNNIVRDSKIYKNGGSGILLSSGSMNEAYNNEIWGNIIGIQIDYGAVDTKVHDNVVYQNRDFGIYIGPGSSNTDVEDNDVYDSDGPQIANYGSATLVLP